MLKHQITVSGVTIDVTRKNVKNVNLRVYPSDGRVSISCPPMLSHKKILQFTEERIDWIKKHLEKPRKVTPKRPNYVSGEIHSLWGEKKILVVSESKKPRRAFVLNDEEIHLRIKPTDTVDTREKVLDNLYRTELKREIPGLIAKWEPVMGVSVNEFGVKKMKTRWGTCNIRAKRIWLNLELAKKDPACLEFIVVHELVHLLERLHSKRFYRLMDQFLPKWREHEKLLKY